MREQRRAMLDPEHAELYPELPAGIWMAAWHAAMKQADRLWLDLGPRALRLSRVLRDEHFRFRGGQPRGGSSPAHERVSDPVSRSWLGGQRYSPTLLH